MKVQFGLILLFVAVSVRARNVRDIGLLLQGDHDHHHDHHHHEEHDAASTKQGYGRDIPEPALPVSLTAPEETKTKSGYPRENPPNPLKIDAEAANDVEVRVQADQSNNNNNMMMMGGEIPGTAGVDYPIYDTVPETSFKCEDQATGGYYADEEGRCQVFHICHDNFKSSFLCPNGTLFQQKYFVCDWWFNVDCAASKDFFNLNAQIGVVPEKSSSTPETEAVVAASSNVASPSLDYLPPQESVIADQPSQDYLPPQEPVIVEKPSLDYLPPQEPVVAAPAQPSLDYLPPAPAATAREALANGILA